MTTHVWSAAALFVVSVLFSGCVVEEGCGHSLCGCPHAVELTVSNTVETPAGDPIIGAEVRCSDGTGSPVLTTTDGSFSLTVSTTQVEWCDYTECNEITVTSPGGSMRTLESNMAIELDRITLSDPLDAG